MAFGSFSTKSKEEEEKERERERSVEKVILEFPSLKYKTEHRGKNRRYQHVITQKKRVKILEKAICNYSDCESNSRGFQLQESRLNQRCLCAKIP